MTRAKKSVVQKQDRALKPKKQLANKAARKKIFINKNPVILQPSQNMLSNLENISQIDAQSMLQPQNQEINDEFLGKNDADLKSNSEDEQNESEDKPRIYICRKEECDQEYSRYSELEDHNLSCDYIDSQGPQLWDEDQYEEWSKQTSAYKQTNHWKIETVRKYCQEQVEENEKLKKEIETARQLAEFKNTEIETLKDHQKKEIEKLKADLKKVINEAFK